MNSNNRLNTFPLALSGLALSLLPVSGAIVSLSGGVEGGNDLQSQNRYVVDLGFLVPTLPVTTDLALFEGGGDGDGTAIALLGNTIQVFLDISAGTLVNDTTFGVDISSFAGQVITIRLQGDYTGASVGADTAQLDIFNGTTTLSSNSITLNSNYVQAAGSDGFGTGGRGANSWPGGSEDPSMAQFGNDYDIGSGGVNVLGSNVLEGVLYTGPTDSDAALASGIPAPSSWNVIPEPSTGLLTLLSLGLLAGQRRRKA